MCTRRRCGSTNARGWSSPRAHERPQPPLFRRRHRAAAPHPGAHQRRHLAGRCAAHPRTRGRPATPARDRGAGSKTGSTRCSARWRIGSPPCAASIATSWSRAGAPRSCAPIRSASNPRPVTTGLARQGHRRWHSTRTSSPARPKRRSAPRRRSVASRATPRSRPSTCSRALLDQPEGVVNGVLERIGVDLSAVRGAGRRGARPAGRRSAARRSATRSSASATFQLLETADKERDAARRRVPLDRAPPPRHDRHHRRGR